MDAGKGRIVTPGTRSQSRDSMFMSATIRLAGSTAEAVPIRIRNISPGGMMGDARIQLVAGDMVELSLKAIGQIRGTVAWADDERIGIAFAVSVDPQIVRRQVKIREQLPAALGAGRRPGVRTA